MHSIVRIQMTVCCLFVPVKQKRTKGGSKKARTIKVVNIYTVSVIPKHILCKEMPTIFRSSQSKYKNSFLLDLIPNS